MIHLYAHQKAVLKDIHPGSILVGGVGSGKSLTALAYYFKRYGGYSPVTGDSRYIPISKKEPPLYIITTARKRDSLDWEKEASNFGLTPIVDSWNNIKKYTAIKGAFFFFDEQRLVGNGVWVKSFLKISKNNLWIMLTATPGDNWEDYIPVMIANGYYKNRSEFQRRHIAYNPFTKFPKIDRFIEVERLIKIRNSLLINMYFKRKTERHMIDVYCDYDKEKMRSIAIDRWNIYEEEPIKDVSQLYFLMRKLVNSDPSRLTKLADIVAKHNKVIVFYNFNYELDILSSFALHKNIPYSQWNGHKHEEILKGPNRWLYLCQYTSASEAWNAIQTNTIVFFSQNYSYRLMEQAAGRIDRLNTTFIDLYYYTLMSYSMIDMAIKKSIANKKIFNERSFEESRKKHML